MTRFRLRIGDEQREYDVTRQGDRLRVTSGELSVQVRILRHDDGRLLIEVERPDGPRRIRAVGARQGDRRLLWVGGRAFTAERVRRTSAARGPDLGSLASSIPAVVSQVLVAPDDLVATGDKLILLESMKMVIPILAPHGGRVARILCAPGDSVAAGVQLLEIEPE